MNVLKGNRWIYRKKDILNQYNRIRKHKSKKKRKKLYSEVRKSILNHQEEVYREIFKK